MKEQEKERFVYIYNPEQASYYMSQGITAKATGVHPTTKRVWYKFSFEQTSIVYEKWCTRCK